MCSARRPVTFDDLASGAIACTLTPFDETGGVMGNSITDQVRRLVRVEGVIGIAVNMVTRERLTLTPEERLEVIHCTRKGLEDDQILISCVGEISDRIISDVTACKAAGADAIVAFQAKWQIGSEGHTLNARLDALTDLEDTMSLPVIVIPGHSVTHRTVSSEAALFHNLNSGGNVASASLACIAPHEVASLYAASRKGQTHNGRALQHRLSPLIQFLSEHEQDMREMIYREAATFRGILTTPYARDLDGVLCPDLKSQLHRVIVDSGFKPVSWI